VRKGQEGLGRVWRGDRGEVVGREGRGLGRMRHGGRRGGGGDKDEWIRRRAVVEGSKTLATEGMEKEP